MAQVARAHALNERNFLWGLTIGRSNDLAHRRARGAEQPLKLRTRQHIRKAPKPILPHHARIIGLKPRRKHHGANFQREDSLGLGEVERLAFAGFQAVLWAAPGLEEYTRLGINDGCQGHSLREGDVDGLALAQAHVKLAGEFGLLIDA
jgi:hypothetical protein